MLRKLSELLKAKDRAPLYVDSFPHVMGMVSKSLIHSVVLVLRPRPTAIYDRRKQTSLATKACLFIFFRCCSSSYLMPNLVAYTSRNN